jgi:alpha-tubulin suppressor-like RCC1 family protein
MTGVTQAAATEHTCARKQDGSIWCWGHNACSQTGDGTTTDRLTPAQVAGITGASVVTGTMHTCVMMADGTVRCWGENHDGQLGNGTVVPSATPVQVQGMSGVVQISTAGVFTVARRNDNSAWSWGSTPSKVQGITAATQVSGGGTHACALLPDKSVVCSGGNANGQLGDGTQVMHTTALPVVWN